MKWGVGLDYGERFMNEVQAKEPIFYEQLILNDRLEDVQKEFQISAEKLENELKSHLYNDQSIMDNAKTHREYVILKIFCSKWIEINVYNEMKQRYSIIDD